MTSFSYVIDEADLRTSLPLSKSARGQSCVQLDFAIGGTKSREQGGIEVIEPGNCSKHLNSQGSERRNSYKLEKSMNIMYKMFLSG